VAFKMNFKTQFFVFEILLTYFVKDSTSQDLIAEYCQATLSLPVSFTASIYDGDDSILIFGGSGDSNMIYQYSISNDDIQVIGSIVDSTHRTTSVLADREGNYLYFGSSYTQKSVTKFSPVKNTTDEVASLPFASGWSGTILDEETDTAYMMGMSGSQMSILSYDMTRHNFSIKDSLPGPMYPSAAVKFGGVVYVFGETRLVGRDPVYIFNMNTHGVTKIDNIMPDFSMSPSAVVAGDFIYVVGGYTRRDGVFTNAIIRFNPETMEVEYIFVKDFLIDFEEYFSEAPDMVYVEKLNRIYFFGGFSWDYLAGAYKYHNEIWYVTLNP